MHLIRNTHHRKPLRRAFFGIAIVFLASCGLWAFIEPLVLTTRTHSVEHPDVPPGFNGYRIGFVSDLHIGRFTSPAMLSRVTKRLEGLDLDMLVLGGDYVYRYTGDLSSIFSPFSAIPIPDGIYGVSGNHDHWEDYSGIIGAMEDSGIASIENETIYVDRGTDSITLSGIPDLWYPGFADGNVNTAQDENEFRILVSHNPDYLRMHSDIFDLGLAGHTHGGQITVFGLWAPVLPTEYEWTRGRSQIDQATIVISRGIGVIGLPMRFFAPPEITVIELQQE